MYCPIYDFDYLKFNLVMTELNVDFSRIQNVPTNKNLEAHLIEEVRKFPSLWDTTICAYKETPLKVEAWRQISTLLNAEGSYLFSQVNFNKNMPK